MTAATGTGALTLTGSAGAGARPGATAHLDLGVAATGTAMYTTDTSNAFDGLDLVTVAYLTVVRPVPAPPATAAVKYDVALPYPQPVMVGGRPT